jgi:formiminotetrahydrofolate cyclodeaminase
MFRVIRCESHESMPSFASHSLTNFLDAVASPEPTPGGGSVAAIAGAMGTSLLMMVAGLTRTRNNSEDERASLGVARATVLPLRDRLVSLADTDTEAYDQVTSAYRLPKATDAEKATRKDAIQRALRAATLAPLDTLKAVADTVRSARTVAAVGNRSATSDIGVALGLLAAAADGAAMNVRINLEMIQDEDFKNRIGRELVELEKGVRDEIAAARAALV